jgi:uncharacterized membrane protein
MREKPPKVRYVKGKDKMLMVGLIPLLIKPITTAAINAAGKLAISTPGTAKSTISKLKAVASAMKKYDNIFYLSNSNISAIYYF